MATTGANTVSLNRRRHFKSPHPPWRRTTKTIYDIGLPEDIVKGIVENQVRSELEVFREGNKVEVRFLRSYCRLFKKGEVKKISQRAFYELQKKGFVELLSEPEYEQIYAEL